MSGLFPGCGPMTGFGEVTIEAQVRALPGRIFWARSDSGVSSVGGVFTWTDRTGDGRHLVSTDAASFPAIHASGGVNNLPYLRFGEETHSRLNFSANALAGQSALEAFTIFSRDSETDADTQGGLYELWGTNISSHVPYHANGQIYDSFATNLRKDGIACPPGLTTSACCYNAASTTNYWQCSLNGQQLFTTTTNGYGMGPTPGIGSHGTTVFLRGKLYEEIFFSRVLTAPERALVTIYASTRYSFAIP